MCGPRKHKGNTKHYFCAGKVIRNITSVPRKILTNPVKLSPRI